MNLLDQGFRYVQRGREFRWVHPAEMLASDIDCTLMDDAAFEAQVAVAEAA